MIFSLYLLLLSAVCGSMAASPQVMDWSSKTFGPDGPWHAVKLTIGSDKQNIAVYPGSRFTNTILAKSICDNTTTSTTCYANDAGLYNPKTSASLKNATDMLPWYSYWFNTPTGQIWRNVAGENYTLSTGRVLTNIGTTVVYDAFQTYPNGKNYPISVGSMSLGRPSNYQQKGNGTLWYINGHLQKLDVISSYSYGLHIGSAEEPNIPPSLYLGGFDKNRVLGEVSSQQYVPAGSKYPEGSLVIRLLDIGIGVASGGSPFAFTSKNGLWAQNNSDATDVYVHSERPYMYLPKATCDALTSDLPVTFNDSLGLYFWNTSDPQYKRIVASPAYLSFTFEKNANNQQNMTIKVPYSLMNLTLEEPLVDKPTQYFPCYPDEDTRLLGRAFLQAAFLGVNWGTGTGDWFLAQAPGPDVLTNPSVTTIEDNDTAITGSGSSWEQTWASYWTPIGTSESSTSTSSGLSTGAKAGIGVGCAIAGIILIALAWAFIVWRKRAAARNNVPAEYPPASTQDPPKIAKNPVEMESTPPVERYELD
ncbi:hypothetical protein ASPWEDRAFT_50338 [Aspergillus wentii DTO 134E9]|uniref:Peptidase A1 domain-containing protein n=1 Tax=Aspergillus wentii DTO 134E9 TaxID=1073089 RepID=A0A1L9RPW2_ASPWE|nr:uncharacterized protein ASPWEDRAFT_50338 [Aspergillus wentii DTO 134E9]OJJ36964.1 hypothetical protein ASPWEDRAFT_50338 [Aspergillus wentii DTO 134E9]